MRLIVSKIPKSTDAEQARKQAEARNQDLGQRAAAIKNKMLLERKQREAISEKHRELQDNFEELKRERDLTYTGRVLVSNARHGPLVDQERCPNAQDPKFCTLSRYRYMA